VARLGKSADLSSNTRQSRDPEVTQAEILAAAEEEFAKQGFSGARTEIIAERTGVTKSMIYYYFKSKEGLYQAVLDKAFSDYLRISQQLDLDKLPADKALHQFVSLLLDNMSSRPNLTLILFYEALQNQGKYYQRTGLTNVYTILTEILNKGLAEGVFRSLDPRQTAINIVGICAFYFVSQNNLKYLYPGKRALSKEMLDLHKQEALALIAAGVRVH
jgi:TetR/AcrR family transcriptional regulator